VEVGRFAADVAEPLQVGPFPFAQFNVAAVEQRVRPLHVVVFQRGLRETDVAEIQQVAVLLGALRRLQLRLLRDAACGVGGVGQPPVSACLHGRNDAEYGQERQEQHPDAHRPAVSPHSFADHVKRGVGSRLDRTAGEMAVQLVAELVDAGVTPSGLFL
jgi:hypothetical protein